MSGSRAGHIHMHRRDVGRRRRRSLARGTHVHRFDGGPPPSVHIHRDVRGGERTSPIRDVRRAGWTSKTHKGQRYFEHDVTKETTWEWIKVSPATDRPYYLSLITNEALWERPDSSTEWIRQSTGDFVHKYTGDTTPEWINVSPATDRPYYVSLITKEKLWELPVQPAALINLNDLMAGLHPTLDAAGLQVQIKDVLDHENNKNNPVYKATASK